MKGIILAGGSGTRLYPLTVVTSKQLLPIYDKPMIYYPLSVLMMAGIQDILIISTPEDTPRISKLLGNGEKFGLNLSYKVQPSPNGLAQAFILGEEFIGNEPIVMILGDNIFYGAGLKRGLKKAVENLGNNIATIFGYHVPDPERFGVVDFDSNNRVISLEEKPVKPKSNYAVTGLYFYDNSVIQKAKSLKLSARGELEITDINKLYLNENRLDVITFGRGMTWLDTGTHESLADATAFVKMIEEHQGLKVSCPEEIAYQNGWITKEQLIEQGNLLSKSQYGKHLLRVANDAFKESLVRGKE